MTVHRNIVAVLGPTNTGKTHLAIETMLRHKSGVIGLPLRLLAREVYDRVCQSAGRDRVALVTGEEKILPVSPAYWICTTEAMPEDLRVEFVALDEIQLCGDRERGHVFTDRLLHWRGTRQTMFLGAATMRPTIETLVPGARIENRHRLSRLTYAGVRKISRLPRRSAIVGFSADSIYSLAELLRRQRGGAAVIMGNLSPRTRNAQVALYQSGEVDYLVATDAIGMGLNMDIDHVAFAALRKFDGIGHRNLTHAEMGQIAGRAGRYKNDGTFGTTARAAPLEPETIEYLETHDFEPIKAVQWRNRNLNFAGLDQLIASLKAHPNRKAMVRARPATDLEALEILSRDEAIIETTSTKDDVALLWQVCQLPDYRNISASDHAALVAKIYHYLQMPNNRIDSDWLERQLSFCDRVSGDIDTLSNRISHIRTWTFVANRAGWTDDPLYWQGRTREIEDRLSDALHEALTQRFIDRRTSQLMKKLRQGKEFMSTIKDDGTVLVEDEVIGRLQGFQFVCDLADSPATAEMRAASAKTVRDEIAARAVSLTAAPDQDISLDDAGALIWQNQKVAVLAASDQMLKPVVRLLADDNLSAPDRQAVEFRLNKFLQRHILTVLGPLQALTEDEEISGIARGVVFRLCENLGVLERREIAADIKALDQTVRASLRKHGVRFGAYHIFVPALLKPAATSLRLLLWKLSQQKDSDGSTLKLPAIPGQGLTSAFAEKDAPAAYYLIAGFKVCGNRIVRIDMLERLGDMIRKRVFWRPTVDIEERPEGSVEGGGFTAIPDMMSLVGCSGDEFSDILTTLGYRCEQRTIEKPAEAETTTRQDISQGLTGKEAQSKPELSDEVEKTETQPSESITEPHLLTVWWPENTGPFRRGPQKSGSGKKRREKPANTARSKQKPAKRKKPVTLDKDSPFAVLEALKKKLK